LIYDLIDFYEFFIYGFLIDELAVLLMFLNELFNAEFYNFLSDFLLLIVDVDGRPLDKPERCIFLKRFNYFNI